MGAASREAAPERRPGRKARRRANYEMRHVRGARNGPDARGCGTEMSDARNAGTGSVLLDGRPEGALCARPRFVRRRLISRTSGGGPRSRGPIARVPSGICFRILLAGWRGVGTRELLRVLRGWGEGWVLAFRRGDRARIFLQMGWWLIIVYDCWDGLRV